MQRLTTIKSTLNSDVSSDLRQEIQRFVQVYSEIPCLDRYRAMESIRQHYFAEKGPAHGEPWQILSVLVSAVTGARWTTGKFTYYYHVARKVRRATDPGFEASVWKLMQEDRVEPCTMQKVLEHAQTVSQVKGLPFERAFEATVRRLRRLNEERGRPWKYGLWSEKQWSKLRKMDQISPKAPPGQRKRSGRKAEPKQAQPRRSCTPAETRSAKRLQVAFKAFVEARIASLPEDIRGLESALALGEFQRLLAFVRASTLSKVSEQDLKNHALCVKACAELGITAPKKGLPVPPGEAKKAYRSLALITHPDHHPGASPEEMAQLQADFNRLTEAHKFLLAYNERIQP